MSVRVLLLLSASSLALGACGVEDPAISAASAVAPPPGSLTVSLDTQPIPAEPFQITVSGATLGDGITLGRGTGLGTDTVCPAVLLGECLDLIGPAIVADGTADGFGELTLTAVLPEGLSPGLPFALQAVSNVGTGPVDVSAGVSGTIREPIAVFGVWDDPFGGQTEVDHQQIRGDFGLWHVIDHDNAAGWILARNDAGNAFAPDLYSRFDVTFDGTGWHYCQSAFDAPTEADALAAPAADATDLAAGCGGGFPWTAWSPAQPAIAGGWTDDFGTTHVIGASLWEDDFGLYHVTRFSNDTQTIIAQNDSANGFFPDLYSRFDWTEFNGETWYCQTAFAAATEYEARTVMPADPTDPPNGGCGTFAWSRLNP